AMADDDVLDLLGVETGLFHPRYQNLFGFFRRIQRVNNNDAFACCQCPCTNIVKTDVVEVVETLRWFKSLAWHRRQTCILTQDGRPLRTPRGAQGRRFRQQIRFRYLHCCGNVRLRLLGFQPLLLRKTWWLLPALLRYERGVKNRYARCDKKHGVELS